MPNVTVAYGDPITDREQRVLELTALGLTASRTGSLLGLTEHTVRTYRKRIQIKLGATCAANAVYLGAVNGSLRIPVGGEQPC